ncbi:hypothetical protein GCM10010274_53330 [Streptomyces lavendofoliae]|uniref:Uncharacterized protein n=1 Tax=Streptomyces lavendofoliae TaxID=67314 RepID=A0A918M7B7_9ACTN|nr:hypothetical protein GCM10010274_53330 [Streptomyces lavendofoliae]
MQCLTVTARFRRESTAGYRSAAMHIRRAGQPPTVDGSGLEPTDYKLVMGATAAQGFEVGGGAVAGGSLDVDEVADGAAVGEGTDLGADHVVEERTGP